MAEIIDFARAKEDREPHASGLARCLECGHEWHAIAPVGTTQLECSECKTMKGIFTLPFAPNEYLLCACGSDLFYVTRNGVFCPKCGEEDEHPGDN